MRLIGDIESDGLLDEITQIHCLVLRDIDTNKVHVFNSQSPVMTIEAGLQMAMAADLTVWHNGIMGILSTHPKLVPGKRIIVSEDKDLQTIPGWIWNPAKDAKPRYISEEQADYFHLYQTLVGDTTDGYKGCPGIGKTKAPGILQEGGWEAVRSAYARKGLTEEDALLQARVARICRASDYDFKKQEVILWNP